MHGMGAYQQTDEIEQLLCTVQVGQSRFVVHHRIQPDDEREVPNVSKPQSAADGAAACELRGRNTSFGGRRRSNEHSSVRCAPLAVSAVGRTHIAMHACHLGGTAARDVSGLPRYTFCLPRFVISTSTPLL